MYVAYVPRLIDHRLDEIMATFPAVSILGPRAIGKTTTARRFAATTIELDDPAQAAQFRADPTAALDAVARRTPGAILLDEWQEAPEVIGAVKRAVDHGAPPGSFILTGSVRAPLSSASWPGTGRLITIDMHPMTVLERDATACPRSEFVPRAMSGDITGLDLPTTLPDLPQYVRMAVAGGYPPVIELDDRARMIWLDSYIDQLVQRDVPALGDTRDPHAIRRVLRALAECTGTLTAATELAAAADINVKTVRRHEDLLEDLRIVTSLPAWHTNRLNRLVKQHKRYLVDTGLASALLEADDAAILADGDLLGRTLENFVLAQLVPLLGIAHRRITPHHLRQQSGRREVDILLESANGRVVGIEVKASAGPSAADARHLRWLRDEIGEVFTAGLVLHTGKWIYQLDERVFAVPIAALWGEPEQ